ncbi:MAG: hypothetical protein INQ03_14225 [Candidatus Heimdallarchaeota archaeon]|nr:hypothetical protein [Candidatus Heimdallarchaeota archaeon]
MEKHVDEQADSFAALLVLSDLSIQEIITLQILARQPEPLKRYHLYLEVMQFFDHQKKISTSSFYNSLNNMETMGIVQYNLKDKKKIDTVIILDKGRFLMQSMLNYIISSSFSMEKIEVNFIAEIERRLQAPTLGEVLVIDTSRYVEVQLLQYLASRANTVTVVSLDDYEQDFSQLHLPKFYQTECRAGKIREPDMSYDHIIIPVFTKAPLSGVMSSKELMQEVNRLLKSQGVLITTSFSKFPNTANAFANQILNRFQSILSERVMAADDVQQEFSEITRSKTDIFDVEGMLIGMLWKP